MFSKHDTDLGRKTKEPYTKSKRFLQKPYHSTGAFAMFKGDAKCFIYKKYHLI